jgi:hypothetical protein
MLNCQTSAAKRSNSGTYYYNARWYDAGTGRFISEDPARDGANWYVYVRITMEMMVEVDQNLVEMINPKRNGMKRAFGRNGVM